MIWVDDGQGGQHAVVQTTPDGEGLTACGMRVPRPFYNVDVADQKCHVCRKYEEGRAVLTPAKPGGDA